MAAPDRLSEFGRHHRGRRLFHQFLVAPLHRAVAFPQVDVVSVGVGDQLDFDVTRTFHELLDVDGAVVEGGRRFGLRGRESRHGEISFWATRIPRPPPPAAALIMTG
jgi:hypothetical protein